VRVGALCVGVGVGGTRGTRRGGGGARRGGGRGGGRGAQRLARLLRLLELLVLVAAAAAERDDQQHQADHGDRGATGVGEGHPLFLVIDRPGDGELLRGGLGAVGDDQQGAVDVPVLLVPCPEVGDVERV